MAGGHSSIGQIGRQKAYTVYLVQMLFPLYDNRGRRLPKKLFDQTARTLAKAHGGVTAYTRSPAVGLWNSRGSGLKKDEIVIYEVVTTALHAPLWERRRKMWEATFRQDSLLIRAIRCWEL
jgi:hypothetical protein